MLKLIIFIIVSAGISYISRASLRFPHSHGFYRFFAWEAILALILLNMEHWFRNPFSMRQIVSWLLLIASLFLAAHGFRLLRVIGKPDTERREKIPMIGFEKTTTLVTVGAFKYIRHPLYSSLFFLGWGVFFKDPSWLGGVLSLAATIFLAATAKVEETENIHFFGPAYQMYMKRTKMFIPFLF
ncbi:isoprenylcysteine carboxylmethyltransferase family protein [bacterium]|nr:isoprenylcysteine carboxylmethyltransferase family protein [bacterium]